MQFSQSQQSRTNTRCGGESLKRRCCQHWKNLESVSFYSALSSEAFSRGGLTRTLRSKVRTCVALSLALRRTFEKRFTRSLICLARSETGRRRHQRISLLSDSSR